MMTTLTHPVAAVEAAGKVLKLIKHRLPEDSRWILSEAEDGFYHMTIYANVEGTISILELAAPVMGVMLRKGIPFVVMFNSPGMLSHLPADIDVRDINWPAGADFDVP
jgi:hypothetical protein